MAKKVIQWIFTAVLMTGLMACNSAVKDEVLPVSSNVSYPDITSDNYGGAYAVYQVFKSQSNANEIYVQRINASGSRLFGEKGILVASIGGIFAGEPLNVLADNNGNAIVAWRDKQGITSLIRLNQQGHILWQKKVDDFVYTSQIISDSAGGLIYVADDSTLKRIDAEGNPVWTKTTSSYDVNRIAGKFLISDGLGGAITHTLESNTGERTNIYIQRIDSNGNYSWQKDDTLLYSTDKEINDMSISDDGTGGAVVIWTENKWDWEQPKDYDVRALRIDKNGNILWQKNNEPLEVFQPGERLQTLIAGDGHGGAFAFGFSENGQAILGQRISPVGDFIWPTYDFSSYEGGAYCLAYGVAPDSNEGVILARCLWEGAINRYLKAQRIGPDGKSLYPEGEVRPSNDILVHPFYFVMTPDGDNGALLAWGSSQDLNAMQHSSVQRINGKGEPEWGDSGIRLDDWNNSFTTIPPAPFFAVKKEADPNYIYFDALAEGKLVLDNNNLRLKPSWGKGDVWSKGELLIWPYGYSLRIEGKEIQIIDNYGHLVARVGDKIKVGGGEVPAEIVEKYIGQQLPDDCTGPYWLVSRVIDN
jgi:hypothetical protein